MNLKGHSKDVAYNVSSHTPGIEINGVNDVSDEGCKHVKKVTFLYFKY